MHGMAALGKGAITPPHADVKMTDKAVRFDETVKLNDVESKEGRVKDHDFYFNFYSSLQNQANMIGDITRTGTYKKAILGNAKVAFEDKVVLDVGAGSGILSYMSAQAGAKHVVALEASSMAEKISTVGFRPQNNHGGRGNPHLKGKVRVVRGMVEDAKTQDEVLRTGKVDTIISEPIGVILLHERMVESFILARDLFLKPGGQLLPSGGHIFFAPFTDEALYTETEQKAQFFNATLFGTDFTELYPAAREEAFSQVIIGMFPPTSLVGPASAPKSFDFHTCTKDDLVDFIMPIEHIVTRTAVIHGLASWFDLDFLPNPVAGGSAEEDQAVLDSWEYDVNPAASTWGWMQYSNPLDPESPPTAPANGLPVRMSTAPYAPRTHWQQARLLLPEPLAANKGERLTGEMRFKANDARSYDMTVTLRLDRPGKGWDKWDGPNPLERKATWDLSQQCINYSYTPPPTAPVPNGTNVFGIQQ